MKTDRELLELAAKAGGELTASWYGNDAYFDGVLSRWNPLNDDGDALRLAVRLSILVDVTAFSVTAIVNGYISAKEKHNGDPYAATRRAIVGAAAAIGEGMK
jgi:hypothetical protein